MLTRPARPEELPPPPGLARLASRVLWPIAVAAALAAPALVVAAELAWPTAAPASPARVRPAAPALSSAARTRLAFDLDPEATWFTLPHTSKFVRFVK